MELTKNTIQKMLESFGIDETVEGYHCLVNIDYQFHGERVIKCYTRIETRDQNYILKVLRLPMCPEFILEKQMEISQLYRREGIPVPKCFLSPEHKYCAHFQLDEINGILVLEEDAGEILNSFSEEVIQRLGALLGKMHKISLENGWRFREGSFYREFCAGNTAYLPLWKDVEIEALPRELLKKIVDQYDKHLSRMKNDWESLPVAMVQGDFYRLNWTEKEGNLMVIDYDRAGDEVLLADFLIAWFRMKYDPVIRQIFPKITQKEMFEKFIKAYESERKLTEEEKSAFQDEYAVLGAVYGTRYFAGLALAGNLAAAKNGLEEILEILR